MRAFPQILLFGLIASTSLAATLPKPQDVFAIGSYTASSSNYISSDYIYSALPFYVEVSDADSTDSLSAMTGPNQGAIVLRDKTILFFEAPSPKYLNIVDESGHLRSYLLSKTPSVRIGCPKAPAKLNALPFPKPQDVFCAATFPWNPVKHFTPQSLIESLLMLRPLTEKDIPARSILSGNNDGEVFVPKEWIHEQRDWMQTTHINPALGGVLVLTNRAILKWGTWDAHSIHFENYHPNIVYIIDEPRSGHAGGSN